MSESKQNADNSVEIDDQQEEYREGLLLQRLITIVQST